MNRDVYQPTDRRPLASRNWSISKRLADGLVARHVSPNAISLAGMLFGMLAGAALAATVWPAHFESSLWTRVLFAAAAVLVQLRLLCNLLDGMVAVQSHTASKTGELYNDVPDRISDSATLIGVGYALGGQIELGYLCALLAVFGAYVRVLGKSLGLPMDFCGPLAKQHRMALVTLGAVYCAIAPAAWQPKVGRTGMSVMGACLAVILIGTIVTSIRRLIRIARQLRGGS